MTEDKSDDISVSDPWYRFPWVWLVFGIPFSAVLFGIVMMISAGHRPDDLVVDNYYKEGMGINQSIALDKRAAELDLIATLSFQDQKLTLDIPGHSDVITLSMYHVTDKEQDMTLPIQANSDMHVATGPDAEELIRRLQTSGVWYLEINDSRNQWRLRTRTVTPIDTIQFTP